MLRSTIGLFGMLILASCATSAPPIAEPTPPAAATPAPAPRADLSGTNWRLETLAGAPPIEGRAPTLSFGTDGRVSGGASCNRYFGTYSAETGFGQMGSTRMFCQPATIMEQERAYLGILGGATDVAINSDNLLVITGTNGQRAVFAPVSTGS